MAFIGMSSRGKEAQSTQSDYMKWANAQMKAALQRGNAAGDTGDYAMKQYYDWANARQQQGIGTPADAWATGGMIQPGVDPYIANRQATIQGIRDQWGSLPSWQTTAGALDTITGEQAGNITGTTGAIEGDISDTAGRAFGREAAATGDIRGDLATRYGALMADTSGVYGGLRGKSADVYGGLKGSAEDTYGQALGEMEQLKPGSMFAQARAARSFAPAMAASAGRLRRAGLDPGSPQAMAALQRVEAERSRAIDDAAAAGTLNYVQGRQGLLLGREAGRQNLALGELGNEQGLTTDEAGINRNLSLDQGGQLRGEIVRSTGAQQGIDAARSAQEQAALNDAYNRTAAWNTSRAQNEMAKRGMAQQDWGTASDLARERDAAEREGIDLKTGQFGQGLNFNLANLAERNAGGAAVGDYGKFQQGQSMGWNQAGQGWGNTAANQANTIYQQEAPNASWGLKMIGGAAAAGLDMVAPGTGNLVRGAMGQPTSTQGQGGYFPGQPAGGGWPQVSNPYGPTMTGPTPTWNYTGVSPQNVWDPNKTKTLPSGALQIGRYS